MTVSQTILFSVIIPLFNKRPYVGRAVTSVLQQNHTDFELIVVDDGSTDAGHLSLSAVTDPRYRLIRQANGGVGAARNAGMREATGRWIAFLDADDMWLPYHLNELKRIASAHPEAGLIATRIAEVADGQGYGSANSCDSTIKHVDYFLEASRSIALVTSSSAAVSKSAFDTAKGFMNFRAGEDLEYWARVALKFPVAVSDRTTSIYFRGTGGVTETIAAEPKSVRPIADLSDLSASIAMLCMADKREPGLLSRPNIRAYINARIFSGIRGSVARQEWPRARQLSQFLLGPLSLRERAAVAVLHAPHGALSLAMATYRGGRTFWRGRR